jgi:hypothetical protein
MIIFGRRSRADACHRVHVDERGLAVHLVRRDVEQAPGEVELHPVREMATVGERQAHDRVPRGQQRVEDRGVGLGARVGLDVGVLGAEERLGAIDRELLGDVDPLAAAVVALAGVALGVLVRQHGALRLEHRLGHEVLAGDHLQRALLALELARENLRDLGIHLGERAVEGVRRQVAHLPDRLGAQADSSSPIWSTRRA